MFDTRPTPDPYWDKRERRERRRLIARCAAIALLGIGFAASWMLFS